MNDYAVREVIENIFGTMSGNSIDYAAAITADLRASGHLRTPGTVEVSRDRVGDAVWLMCEIDTEATEFHEDCCAYFRAALAAGADDGE